MTDLDAAITLGLVYLGPVLFILVVLLVNNGEE
jgi:hypothetical protein